jgi:hypothetical protein
VTKVDASQLALFAAPQLPPGLSADERRVAEALRKHCGKAQAAARSSLAQSLKLDDRELRRIIASLVSTRGLPIAARASSNDFPGGGYYWMTRPDEIAREKSKLTHYLTSIVARLRGLVGGAEAAAILGQLCLTFGPHKAPQGAEGAKS